jgi:aspartate 4-decarboxylase
MEEIFEEPCDAYYKIFSDKQTKGYKYRFLSPFEFKNTLINTATKSVGASKVLNAGRGNPNFFSTMPRYAFALLTKISVELGDQLCCDTDIGFMPPMKGIAAKFGKKLHKVRGSPEGKFLKKACDKMRRISGMEKDDFIHNLVVSTIGCFYPDPPRVQNFVEPVLAEFLDKAVYRSKSQMKGKVKIMPTEGCAAAILYVFNSLKYNGLVVPGDKIGIITPIFSPYLEIPALRNYNLTQICIKSDESNNWEIPQSEIEKIGNPEMKALFLVNPTNPTAMSLSSAVVRKIATVVRKKNPNLIILEDNVYAPFVKEFNDFFNVLPRNTIGVFSLSKYFGVTGWRLGTIVMHNSNIIDGKLLNPKFRTDKDVLEQINNRYKMLSTKPDKIKFMDRILADSRQVAEAHVAGLSTPQQTIMSLFATYDLLDREREYQGTLDSMLLKRMDDLLEPIEYEIEETDLNTNYYIVIDICKAADGLMGGTDFGTYLKKHRDPLEFLIKLAKGYGTVCLAAVGFAGPFWGIRVSLANLPREDYGPIGENLRSLIDEYYEDFKKYETKIRREEEKAAKKEGLNINNYK